jgi:hypothetical protein
VATGVSADVHPLQYLRDEPGVGVREPSISGRRRTVSSFVTLGKQCSVPLSAYVLASLPV